MNVYKVDMTCFIIPSISTVGPLLSLGLGGACPAEGERPGGPGGGCWGGAGRPTEGGPEAWGQDERVRDESKGRKDQRFAL